MRPPFKRLGRGTYPVPLEDTPSRSGTYPVLLMYIPRPASQSHLQTFGTGYIPRHTPGTSAAGRDIHPVRNVCSYLHYPQCLIICKPLERGSYPVPLRDFHPPRFTALPAAPIPRPAQGIFPIRCHCCAVLPSTETPPISTAGFLKIAPCVSPLLLLHWL